MRKTIYIIRWKVNQHRKDRRTGVLNPIPRSQYLRKLFEEEEQRLKKEVN